MPDNAYTTGGTHPRGMNCPVCGAHSDTIYARVLDGNGTAHPMKPPRCASCAEAWAERNLFANPTPYRIDSRVEPMTQEEIGFFEPYEMQMRDVKPC